MIGGRYVPPPPPRRLRWRVVGAVAAVAILGAGLAGGRWLAGRCGDGVSRSGPLNECVGATDGSVVYAPDIAAVEAKILQENQWVQQQARPYVSIAYLRTMTLSPEDNETPAMMRHQLEGAYIAQLRANQSPALSNRPLIRLLLANPGSLARQWQPAVREIERRVNTSDRLVAVAGLGVSVDQTFEAIRSLSSASPPVPMVGAVITADIEDSAGRPVRIRGLVRVAVPNQQQVADAVAYERPRTRTALVVQDVAPNDTYSRTLGSFKDSFPDADHQLVGQGVEEYDSSLGDPTDTFRQMVPNICVDRPDLVYFAGRSKQLAIFVEQLAAGPCRQLPLTIMTGSDAENMAVDPDVRAALASSRITLTYTGLAHPDEWNLGPASAVLGDPQGFTQFQTLFQANFGEESLDDGQAMMAHDAVVTAVAAIRNRARPPAYAVDTNAVLGELYGLHGSYAVKGASGQIALGNDGNPENKAVPILQLPASGSPVVLQIAG